MFDSVRKLQQQSWPLSNTKAAARHWSFLRSLHIRGQSRPQRVLAGVANGHTGGCGAGESVPCLIIQWGIIALFDRLLLSRRLCCIRPECRCPTAEAYHAIAAKLLLCCGEWRTSRGRLSTFASTTLYSSCERPHTWCLWAQLPQQGVHSLRALL